MDGGARGRRRTGRGCTRVEWRRRLVGLVNIRLRQIDLFVQVLELIEDPILVGDLRLMTLVGCLLIGIEAADDCLEQALQFVRHLYHRVQHTASLHRGFGRRRGRTPNRAEPRL